MLLIKCLTKQSCQMILIMLTSNLVIILLLEMLGIGSVSAAKQASSEIYTDNEFAEFEEYDEDEEEGRSSSSKNSKLETVNKGNQDIEDDGTDAIVEYEDEEDIFKDKEEFELGDGFQEENLNKDSKKKPDELEITKVPIHLRSNWESYYLEFLMILSLVFYFINFIAGRNKNQKLADTWLEVHRDLLESNFTLVGDDGKKEPESSGLVKETENMFTLWCSGRIHLEGMLIEIKLVKRQDLVNTITRLFYPSSDQIIVKTYLNNDAMDSFVFCIANKKTALKMVKEMNDIFNFCPERKSLEKYGISKTNFVLMNEIGEVAPILIDSKVISLINKFSDCLDFIHISDQFSGTKLPDDTPVIKLSEKKKVLMIGINLPTNMKSEIEEISSIKPLMQLVFYLIEKVKRFKLSKEGKLKADKNRQKVEEIFLKATHAQRQEAAQAKREEKKRAEKERMLNEDDPEKQRKWEEREHRKELKRKAPKMKQLKVKAI